MKISFNWPKPPCTLKSILPKPTHPKFSHLSPRSKNQASLQTPPLHAPTLTHAQPSHTLMYMHTYTHTLVHTQPLTHTHPHMHTRTQMSEPSTVQVRPRSALAPSLSRLVMRFSWAALPSGPLGCTPGVGEGVSQAQVGDPSVSPEAPGPHRHPCPLPPCGARHGFGGTGGGCS